MEKHDMFPFTFDEYEDEGMFEAALFIGVVWLEDFGVFKHGEHLTDLRVRYDMGLMESLNAAGDVLVTQRFGAIPVEQLALVEAETGGSD